MLKNPTFAAIVVSVYLLVYYLLFTMQVAPKVIATLFVIAPFLVAWMIFTILRDKNYHAKELKEDEEWGYADKEKDSLGTF